MQRYCEEAKQMSVALSELHRERIARDSAKAIEEDKILEYRTRPAGFAKHLLAVRVEPFSQEEINDHNWPETMRRVKKHISKQEAKTGYQMTQIPIPDKYKYWMGGPKDKSDRFTTWSGQRTHPKDETIIYSTTYKQIGDMTWQRPEPASPDLRDTQEAEAQAGSRINTKEAADALGTSASKLRGLRQEMADMDKLRKCTNNLDRAKMIKKAVNGQPL